MFSVAYYAKTPLPLRSVSSHTIDKSLTYNIPVSCTRFSVLDKTFPVASCWITREYDVCTILNFYVNIIGTFICTWTYCGYVCYILGRILFVVGIWQLSAFHWNTNDRWNDIDRWRFFVENITPSRNWFYKVLTGVCYVLADVAEVWLDDGSLWGTLMMNVASVQLAAAMVE